MKILSETVNSQTDSQLMMSVSNGHIGNLAVLFERHHAKLYNFYLRSTGDRVLSEDMVQDVFLRIIKYRNTFKGEGHFTAWMYSIARNVHIDYAKRWNREQPLDIEDDDVQLAQSSPAREPDCNYDAAFLREALLKLSPEKREVLILSRFEGLKYTEIAELTDSTVENVKVRVHRAIKELRKIFFHLSGDETP